MEILKFFRVQSAKEEMKKMFAHIKMDLSMMEELPVNSSVLPGDEADLHFMHVLDHDHHST